MMKKVILLICILFSINIMAQNEKETMVIFHTSMGDITAKLYNETPKHRDNFIKLINEGWYEGSPFHRVIKNFMLQGGHNSDGRVDPGYTVEAEFRPELYHKKGALSAARMGDDGATVFLISFSSVGCVCVCCCCLAWRTLPASLDAMFVMMLLAPL